MVVLEILIAVACALIVIGVIIASVIRKKQGKPSCGCDCECCKHGCCASQKKQNENNKQ